MQHKKWFATAIAMLVVGFFVVAPAFADDFDYRVKKFSVDGGPYGAYDGTADLVDNMDDLSLSPNWVNNLGTTTEEADNRLHLKSPGSLTSPFPGLNLDRSEVRLSSGIYTKTQGWTVETTFEIDPDTELYEGISFAMDIVGAPSNVLATGVLNYGPTEAAILGVQSGLVVFVAHTDSGFGNLAMTATSITPAQFTGDVVMEFDHAPGASTVEVRISLDGGTAYIDLGSFGLTTGASDPIVQFLYADPLEGSVPPTPTPGPGGSEESKVCYKLKDLKNPKYTKSSIDTGDQFGSQNLDLKKIFMICAPAEVNGSTILDLSTHTCCHKAKGTNLNPPINVQVLGVVGGTTQAQLKKPYMFCEPCSKTILP